VQVRQLDFPCIMAPEPANAWHGVVLFADAKAMEMEVRPVKADLQEDVKIGQGAVGSYEKATPASGGSLESRRGHSKPRAENRVPLRGQPIRLTTPRLFLAPGLKCFLSKLLAHKESRGDMQGAALVKQVSPVAWQHINLYGRYEFRKRFGGVILDWTFLRGYAKTPNLALS
jgi:Tn3 transposase DDE domain